MHDFNLSGPPGGRDGRAIPWRGRPASAAGPAAEDDEILARVLIASWTLATGRTLRDDVRPQFLSEEELISFWADGHMTGPEHRPAGGHRHRGAGPRP